MEHLLQVINLQVEYRQNPIAVDETIPRFSWGFALPARRMQRQTAYQILVSAAGSSLAAGRKELWDSGKVSSNSNRNVVYGGPELQSGRRYYWKVRVWDESGRPSAYSEPDYWEMALLCQEDWKAKWIGVTESDKKAWAEQEGEAAAIPLPIFRTAFQIPQEIVKAKVYLCGLGQFELRLNGEKVGDHVLEPGWTNYDKKCLYLSYDVTRLVRRGENVVGILLGNGFYNVTGGRYTKYLGSFGEPALIMQMEMEFADGSSQRIESGEGWSIGSGPLVFSCIYGGEDYDAIREQPGWDQPGFAPDERWRQASIVPGPKGILKAQTNPPNKVMRRFAPVAVNECSPGVFVYDFGQNFSGWVRMVVIGTRGSTVKLIPGELLDEHGAVNQEWSKGPTYFSYTLKGEGEEEWAPRFSYTGLRYIQIEGAVPIGLDSGHPEDGLSAINRIEGEMIYPDVATVGSFKCSNEMWNKIHEIIDWAILSNMKSVLTDCPHREKLGWLEEVHLMGPSIMYNYDMSSLYLKIVDDMSDSQLDSGLVPDIAPEYTVFAGGFRDSPEWGSAYILAAWYAFNWYGDSRLLERHYDGMKKYVGYLGSRADGDMLNHGLGDWCDAGPNPGFPQNTPIAVTATGTYYYIAATMEKIAILLGKPEDSRYFSQLAERIKKAFNAEFFDHRTGQYATGSQTSNAMPLAVGIVPDHLKKQTVGHIVRDIRSRGNSLTGGDVGFRYLLMALTKYNQAEAVAGMLHKTDNPSYGYQVLHGATTLTELWDGPTYGLSQNHFMLGHAEEWFYSGLAGIRVGYDDADSPNLVIAPRKVEGIRWVKAHHDLCQGRVEVFWEETGPEQLRIDIRIPVNTKAVINLPVSSCDRIREGGRPVARSEGVALKAIEDGETLLEIGSGSYSFEVG